METTVYIRIAGRKESGYPTTSHSVIFDGDIDKFENDVDKIIEELEFRKADVYIDNPEVFSEEEIEELESRYFILV